MKAEKLPLTIDEYIAGFPDSVKKKLEEMRAVICSAAPMAEEKISYQMPTFAFHGNLVHFAAFTNHIGFYPGSSGVAAFKSELGNYKNAKGSIQFPINQPLPLDLVTQVVAFRLAENIIKAEAKKTRKKRT